ncbi:hypothetical protein B9Z55_026955 [Caenorhabditis nigoni]|uniref:Mos1 transposase HTH domain-containing protein n=1 Tax=Caenorhabditis nigoni TaxID=1611254 RepID=A0A2G5SI71_9PELO|nr:hypothetical protein B9Z55_026955 [Caenorhabditis nigoni]
MGKIPEILKNNDHYLKSCILYEVAMKKPIFDSYQSFCNVVGQDVMEYQDFEFWYGRFCEGELDFDYDRSMDSAEPKTLMDMSTKLMRKITDDLNPVERRYLRSMNQDLKKYIDSFPTVFENISLIAVENQLFWKLNENEYECKTEGDGCTFSKPKCLKIEKSDEDCYVCKKSEKITETYEKSYMKKGLEYLTPLFKIPNLQTNHLRFVSTIQSPELDAILPVPFYAKSGYIQEFNFDNLVQHLSILKAGFLEEFTIKYDPPFGIELLTKIFETEQFKQAQGVKFHCYLDINVEGLIHFSHLKQFFCAVNAIEPEEILRIRDIISTFKNLGKVRIQFDRNESPIRQFAEVLDEEIPEGPVESFTHRYQIPESNRTLEMTIRKISTHCYWIDIKV